ncbi:MAG: response regulator [Nitrospirae bacterium]|nr:response regulator [Nitrospirota bacterium]
MATILLVDDEENILKLCRVELEEEGYDVIAVSEGKVAIEKIIKDMTEGRYHIDLVVLDINMPGLDGKKVLKVLKGAVPSLPVVIHTAYDYTKDDFIMFGSDEYVVKSSDLAKLKSTVKYLLER